MESDDFPAATRRIY